MDERTEELIGKCDKILDVLGKSMKELERYSQQEALMHDLELKDAKEYIKLLQTMLYEACSSASCFEQGWWDYLSMLTSAQAKTEVLSHRIQIANQARLTKNGGKNG
jgi:hypothetical protein